MALADTAQLAVNLTLGGNFNAGLTQAESSLTRFGASAGTSTARTGILSGAFSKVGVAAGAVGGALGHAGNQLKGLITGPLGMIGLAGGLFTLGGALTSSIGKIEAFGASLEAVQTLTGETALASGALILQFQKFGLGSDRVAQIVGFTEKTLGKLNDTTGKVTKSTALLALEQEKLRIQMAGGKTTAIDKLISEQKATDALAGSVSKLTVLDKTYGLSLLDSKGNVVDFSTVLSQMATFYDSNASSSTKAYVASQVFGRGYTAMIPILNEGAAGLRAAAAEAQALGLSSTDTVKQLAVFHDQMHTLDSQVNVLQLSIGMALLPTLIDLSKAATAFVSDHRSDIVAFFKNVVSAGKSAVGIIGQVAGILGTAWNSIPAPLQDFLKFGLVADRTIKFLFGFSPIGALVSGIETALAKSVSGGIVSAGLGKMFVQPVFVTNMGVGGMGGGLPGAAGAAEGAAATGGFWASVGGLSGLLTLAAGLAVPVVMAAVIPEIFKGTGKNQSQGANVSGSRGQDFGSLSWQQVGQTGLGNLLVGQGNVGASRDKGQRDFTPSSGIRPTTFDRGQLDFLAGSWKGGLAKLLHPLDALHLDFQKQLGALKTATDPAKVAAATKGVLRDIMKGVGNVGTTGNVLKDLQRQLDNTHDPKLQAVLRDAIGKVEHKLAARSVVEDQLQKAKQIAASSESTKQKLADLKTIENRLIAHGDISASRQVGQLQKIAAKPTKFTANTTVNVSTNVSVRSINTASVVVNRYAGRSGLQAI